MDRPFRRLTDSEFRRLTPAEKRAYADEAMKRAGEAQLVKSSRPKSVELRKRKNIPN